MEKQPDFNLENAQFHAHRACVFAERADRTKDIGLMRRAARHARLMGTPRAQQHSDRLEKLADELQEMVSGAARPGPI